VGERRGGLEKVELSDQFEFFLDDQKNLLHLFSI